jgi:hypothetical protein
MFPYRTPEPPPPLPGGPREEAALIVVLLLCALACIARVVLAVERDETFTAEPTLALLAAIWLSYLVLRTLPSRRNRG